MRENDNSTPERDNVRVLDESRTRREGSSAVVLHAHQIKNMADIRPLSPSELDNLKLIYTGMQNRAALNAFRDIRTKIFQHAGRENFVLMTTAVCDSGGATFTGLNLAAAIALDRSKTSIVIDCNLHHPHLHRLIGDAQGYGLADYIENASVSVDDIIYASGVPRLRVIPAGRECESGVEVFTAKRMHELLGELRSRYEDRCVVIDAPPLTSSADARILQEMCDYVVLVIPYGRVTKGQIATAIESIDSERFVGVIFNDF
jgi:protein-tyrosine kinase